MKVSCMKNDLLNAVNIVLKAISGKKTIPILECILLEGEDGYLKLTGNDLELGIESTIPAKVEQTGCIALEAKIFSEIVRKLPEDEVKINVDSNFMTTIKCVNSEFKIAGQSGLDFPELPKIEKNQSFSLQQGTLKDIIRQTIFSVATEDTRPILTGELIQIKDKAMHMVSVDGYRVSYRKVPLSIENEEYEVVVPGKTLGEISKILTSEEDEVFIYFTDKHILFDLGESMVVSRLLEGEFLKYENSFSEDYETKIRVNRSLLLQSIERAALISREGRKNPIKIEITQDNIIITSNTELGTSREELSIQMEGKELIIAFNPKYLIDALKAIDDEEIVIQFISSLNPCIIKPVEGEDYKYLILPIRLNA
ncbi:DNA polymerase III subunit beta [Defluviitalea phaphyphila]|uniref:DNA polymerase III subunit beta n=1 Tax=Defluviitalea phaphyphila TaxID=1473580 RepID=UPI000730E8CB|nr:DNA polymerase III subunit beta [Defluviitalea phaphyphila]